MQEEDEPDEERSVAEDMSGCPIPYLFVCAQYGVLAKQFGICIFLRRLQASSSSGPVPKQLYECSQTL